MRDLSNTVEAKLRWREMMKNLRDSTPEAPRRQASLQILELIWEYIVKNNIESLHTYFSIGSEVDTCALIERCLTRGLKIYAPRVVGREIWSLRIDDVEAMKVSKLGIAEPGEGSQRQKGKVDLVLLPGLAFGRCGERLGYGGGYYDRFLATIPGTPVGLCFSWQIFDEIPVEPHDVPVKALLSENGWRDMESKSVPDR